MGISFNELQKLINKFWDRGLSGKDKRAVVIARKLEEYLYWLFPEYPDDKEELH